MIPIRVYADAVNLLPAVLADIAEDTGHMLDGDYLAQPAWWARHKEQQTATGRTELAVHAALC